MEGCYERFDNEGPAVDHHEQKKFEWQRHQYRWQHEHAHRHQGGADHHVDDEKRDEDHKSNDERGLNF